MERVELGRLQVDLDSRSGRIQLVMHGQLDEHSKLAKVLDEVGETTVIDLGDVTFVNSVGVREWISFLRNLHARGVDVTLVRCSEPMVHQMNMIIEVQVGATVESFFAPYECGSCGCESSMLLEVDAYRSKLEQGQPPPMKCPECAEDMFFCDLPDRYLVFLQHSRGVVGGGNA
jgi:anti-anti-sigma regulatory factor